MRALKKFMKVWSTLPCTLYNSLNKNVEAINKKKNHQITPFSEDCGIFSNFQLTLDYDTGDLLRRI